MGRDELLMHTAWKIPAPVSLGVVVLILAASVVASLMWPKRKRTDAPGVDARTAATRA